MNTLVELKSLSDDYAVIAGYGIVFGGEDLQGDHFTKSTDLWWDRLSDSPAVLYQHGTDAEIGKEILGRVTEHKSDDTGIWIEAQLDRSKKYVDAILKLVQKGVLGWSSGALNHLVERKAGELKSWPIGEFSLTPNPAEPRTVGVKQLKVSTMGDEMPYAIQKQKQGGKTQYKLVNSETGRVLGTHDSRSEAVAQQRAVGANAHKSVVRSLKALMGSDERTREALQDELMEWLQEGLTPFGSQWAYIVGTFSADNYVVVGTGNGEYWKVPYTVTDNDGDEFEFGTPEEVEMTIISDPDGGMEEGMSEPGKMYAIKEGRAMSNANQSQLHSAMSAISKLHDSVCTADDCPAGGVQDSSSSAKPDAKSFAIKVAPTTETPMSTEEDPNWVLRKQFELMAS